MSDVPGIDHDKIHEDEIAELVRERDEARAERDRYREALAFITQTILKTYKADEDVDPTIDLIYNRAANTLAGKGGQ